VHNGDVNLPFVSFSNNSMSDLDNVSAWMEWVRLLNIGGECDCGVCVGRLKPMLCMKHKSSYHIDL